jgi:hypothetical protein
MAGEHKETVVETALPMKPVADQTEYLVAWVGFRVWQSRATLGLSIRGSAPFTCRTEQVWQLIPHPMFIVGSDGPGDASVRAEWFGVAIYLRLTA